MGKSIKPIKAPESLKSALNRDVNLRAFEIREKMKTKDGKKPSPKSNYKANKFAQFLAIKEKGKNNPELMNKAFPGSVEKIKKMQMQFGNKMYKKAGGKMSKYYADGGIVITGRD
tara:strand:+ start:418 stop:762 length:345 start_codon:yes stop_codon:yes gene_type:complete